MIRVCFVCLIDPDQSALVRAAWSGSALFAHNGNMIRYVPTLLDLTSNFYVQMLVIKIIHSGWSFAWISMKERVKIVLQRFYQLQTISKFIYKKQGSHGQGKVREKWKKFKVREKSGNFEFSQGNLKFLQKSGKSQGILDSEMRVEKSGYKRNKREW